MILQIDTLFLIIEETEQNKSTYKIGMKKMGFFYPAWYFYQKQIHQLYLLMMFRAQNIRGFKAS